ncbi:MAG TPA: hypothetical protein VK755_14675 [Candidatus Acidoferrales bacterium]|jgi:hypothetical protein|nr:hypothetical protein [Candidatus Acidoferrales bacterium]
MNSARLSLRSLAALAVAGMLAGCAGGASAPSTASNALPFMTSHGQPAGASIDIIAMTCKSDHGVSVKPCSIHLSGSNPVESVTTKGPTGGKFTFDDKVCAKDGIAMISGSGNKYQAVWGSKSGSCTALFTDKAKTGKTIGTAKLTITNQA